MIHVMRGGTSGPTLEHQHQAPRPAGAPTNFSEPILNSQGPLLGQRAAVILLLGVLAAAAAGVLTHLSSATPAASFLAAGGAFVAGVLFFHAIIE